MNGLVVRKVTTKNGMWFVYQTRFDIPSVVNAEGYYVTPEGDLVVKNPRRESALKELAWIKRDWKHDLEEGVVEGPLGEKLAKLFDNIPSQRTFGAPKKKSSPFDVLAGLREKMGR